MHTINNLISLDNSTQIQFRNYKLWFKNKTLLLILYHYKKKNKLSKNPKNLVYEFKHKNIEKQKGFNIHVAEI